MAKYKIGDRVRLVSKKPEIFFSIGEEADKYLGKEFIVWNVINQWKGETVYFLQRIIPGDFPHQRVYIAVTERWISGYAEEREREPCTVEIRFDGMTTTATLKRGGRDVKSTEARCNPKDTYSRGEGAKIAVERLFEKQAKKDSFSPECPGPKEGDKFVVKACSIRIENFFRRGDTVTLQKRMRKGMYWFVRDDGLGQWLPMKEVEPYKETEK